MDTLSSGRAVSQYSCESRVLGIGLKLILWYLQVQASQQRGDGEDGGNTPKGGSSESSLRTELYAQQELASRLRSELLAMQQVGFAKCRQLL